MNVCIVYGLFMLAFPLCFVLLMRNKLVIPGRYSLKCPYLLKMLGK